MAHDLVIRNGLLVDGLGNEPTHGDLAIDGDTISAVGEIDGRGRDEIDAEGHAVTPGFVDLHTHFDAQAGWDPLLTPVSWHGVTTALFGNCGVTFAPCKPADRDFLAGMMETVEDIPKDAILNGLAWDWVSYGEYLDSIEKLDPAINIIGLVGHCASRFYVMGERAVDGQPTEDEIRQIAELVGNSVKEGAIGFSSNRLPAHVLPDGRSIPGTFAESAELAAIARAVGKHNGILQFVLNYANLDEEMALITEQGVRAGTRVLFSAPMVPSTNGRSGYADAIAKMRAEGVDVSGLTLPRSGGFVSSLKSGVFMPGVQWKKLRAMDFEGRLAAIRDEAFRQELVEEVRSNPQFEAMAENAFWLGDGDRPAYTRGPEESLASLARAAGEHPIETWLRFMVETNGEAQFHIRFFNLDLDALPAFLSEDWVLPGIGDAGAHVSQIMDSGWTSFLLSHWYRERGVFTLAEAVRKMTSAQARVIGLHDRGVLQAGKRADVNVIDLEKVAERQPQLVHDFPGGAPRLIQKARGYKATVCNGHVILRDDEHTGTRSGRVLRNGAAA